MNASVQKLLHDEDKMGNVLAVFVSVGTLTAGIVMLLVALFAH